MKGPVVYFPLTKHWVVARDLKAYVCWGWFLAQKHGRLGARQFLRKLWRPSVVSIIPEELVYAFNVSSQLGLTPSWARHPTDGTRLQVFDSRAHKICKMLIPGLSSELLTPELVVRQKVGNIAPPIVSVSQEFSAYVEEWISARQSAYSLQVLAQVLQCLHHDLYDIRWIDREQFMVELGTWGEIPEELLPALECAFANLPANAHVPWGMVHGDLVESNILADWESRLVLVDWEYTRECIISYDFWLYLYNHMRHTTKGAVQVAFDELANCLKSLLGTYASDLNPVALHILHLVERIHYLASISPHTTTWIRQMMTLDMQAACQQCSKD